MVVIGVRENAIDSAGDGAQFRNGGQFQADPGGKVFRVVEEGGGAVQRVPRVVNGGTLLGGLMRGTEENPLVGGCHLRAGARRTLHLKPRRQPIQLLTKLTKVLILPHILIGSLRLVQN